MSTDAGWIIEGRTVRSRSGRSDQLADRPSERTEEGCRSAVTALCALYDEDMPNIGPLELVIVLVIVLVIFGPKRLPGLGRSPGLGHARVQGLRHRQDKDEERTQLEADAPPQPPRHGEAEARQP